jgi:DNA mismatch endonuclease, patch repair protein
LNRAARDDRTSLVRRIGRGCGPMAIKRLTRSEIMARVKGKNSSAEKSLRSALHAEGLRFRLHRRVEGITIDIVFPGPRVAVFVDGCFWHSCPRHATTPKTNQDYWISKLAENRERDKRQTALLRRSGWRVIRVWEHDCEPPSRLVIRRISQVRSRTRAKIE